MDLYKVGRPPGINTNSFKVFYTGGERVSAHVLKNLRDVLPDTFVTQGYGQTEASGLITGFDVNSPEEKDMTMRKPESCGRPVPSVDMYKVSARVTYLVNLSSMGILSVIHYCISSGIHPNHGNHR